MSVLPLLSFYSYYCLNSFLFAWLSSQNLLEFRVLLLCEYVSLVFGRRLHGRLSNIWNVLLLRLGLLLLGHGLWSRLVVGYGLWLLWLDWWVDGGLRSRGSRFVVGNLILLDWGLILLLLRLLLLLLLLWLGRRLLVVLLDWNLMLLLLLGWRMLVDVGLLASLLGMLLLRVGLLLIAGIRVVLIHLVRVKIHLLRISLLSVMLLGLLLIVRDLVRMSLRLGMVLGVLRDGVGMNLVLAALSRVVTLRHVRMWWKLSFGNQSLDLLLVASFVL